MTRESGLIVKTSRLAPGIYSMWIRSSRIARQTRPGQFIMVEIARATDPFLARPMSIADVNQNKIRIIYRTVGKGTLILKEKKIGESMYLLGPLGKPVKLPKNKKVVLCAGGVGIAPLLYLGRALEKNNSIQLFFGAKNKKELVLLKEYKPLVQKIYLATEDGSKGNKDYITDVLFNNIKSDTHYLYAAGPLPMLQKISNRQFPVSNLKIFGFLEERMGCGCGICLCCGIIKKSDGYLRICADGPVFNLAEVVL
jgi:dihydroorotate dehydrogenase electron transfer subunit